MADSSAKRRKTSPTTFVPIDAPATPSRIPVPIASQNSGRTSARRPSYASPTKSSLSRHNPQLLNRPSSSGPGSASRGRNLQDVFAKALGEGPPAAGPSIISGEDRDGSKSMSTTQENEPEEADNAHNLTQRPRATTPKARSTKPIGGGLSSKPRRLSRSPIKRPERPPAVLPDAIVATGLPEDFNPFQKKGLRRSPVPGQAELPVQPESQQSEQEIINPFRKSGLRRSPILSQPPENAEITQAEPSMLAPTTKISPPKRPPMPAPVIQQVERLKSPVEVPANISTTPTEQAPSNAGITEIVREELPPQPEDVPRSDDIFLPDGPLGSLGPPRSSRGGLAELFDANRPERPEPELPPTPQQRGIPDPIVTTPPTGIHDTPSKRARKSKALSAKLKSSPLKPRDPPPQVPLKSKHVEVQEEPKPLKPQKNAREEPVKRRKSARFLMPEDPYAAKKKARDDLLKELQQLQADVALANQENERLRLRAEYRKKAPPSTPNPDELVAMLKRATAPERPAVPKPKPTSIFKSISAFLPFNPRRKPTASPFPEKPLPSHLPIALEDPLPYLQAFTGLDYTSTITLLPSNPPPSDSSSQELDQALQQKHLISASHSSGLFSTRFAMTVDTSSLSISSVDILRLDMNAEKELGTFIRRRARDEGPLGKDITVICWAMSRWVEISIKRAQFWCAVEQEFGTPEARIMSFQRKKKRKRRGSIIGTDDDSVLEAQDEVEKSKWTRKQLLQHFGRGSMDISDDEVDLRFEWKISFDWTGEVESFITAAARMPTICM